MIFYLHYILVAAGLSAISVLLGVFMKTYTDASQSEIGLLLMTFPFVSIFLMPYFGALADRKQAHQLYLILALVVMFIGFLPFLLLPFFPSIYTKYPRACWYSLACTCLVGCGAFDVAWSLGDTLAINYSQKTGIPYGRLRLTGTISWGVYGWVIGQVNETPGLPRYVPAFIVLPGCLLTEIILLCFWNKEDFKMFDPTAEVQKLSNRPDDDTESVQKQPEPELQEVVPYFRTPGNSICGTLRLDPRSAKALRDLVLAESPSQKDSTASSKDIEEQACSRPRSVNLAPPQSPVEQCSITSSHLSVGDKTKTTRPNLQLIVFKMILKADGRLIKYLILYVVLGLLLAPVSFLFLSMEELCKEKGYNFSKLAGYVLISQASVETASFLVLPWVLMRVSRAKAIGFALIIGTARFLLYAGWYYRPGVSPYWALVAEWGFGIPYGIYCTLMAEIALMFASESKLFIPELRRMGLMSPEIDPNTASEHEKRRAVAEENAIKMTLRATMQSIFCGMFDGLGEGAGAFLSGVIADHASYMRLWEMMVAISLVTFAIYVSIEISGSRWSDSYKPPVGSKAHAILAHTVPKVGDKIKTIPLH